MRVVSFCRLLLLSCFTHAPPALLSPLLPVVHRFMSRLVVLQAVPL